jgi:putative transposase
MDGRGRCKDNIWIERFWRTLKQDHIYIHPADSVTELRSGITGYLDYYNNERPHKTLGKATCPNECYKISA